MVNGHDGLAGVKSGYWALGFPKGTHALLFSLERGQCKIETQMFGGKQSPQGPFGQHKQPAVGTAEEIIHVAIEYYSSLWIDICFFAS